LEVTDRYLIITAGGKGTRIAGPSPKQFIKMGSKPILAYTLQQCSKACFFNDVILTLPEGYQKQWNEAYQASNISTPHQVVTGGYERFHSVKEALNHLMDIGADGFVAIHDGVRPFLKPELINRLFAAASEEVGAIPVTKPRDSLRIEDADEWQPLDREIVRNVQTPQVFELSKLWAAYQQAENLHATDDAQIWENAGYSLTLEEGEPANFKITTNTDLAYAQFVFEHGTSFNSDS
jgi:2-C-methyl-D-erythritol 4-phosphate cytidylyltransferase